MLNLEKSTVSSWSCLFLTTPKVFFIGDPVSSCFLSWGGGWYPCGLKRGMVEAGACFCSIKPVENDDVKSKCTYQLWNHPHGSEAFRRHLIRTFLSSKSFRVVS